MSLQEVVIKHLGNKCEKCGVKDSLRIHHKVPLSKGGKDDMANLMLLCNRCHGYAHRLINLPPGERKRLYRVMEIMGTKNEIETTKELNAFTNRYEKWFKKYFYILPIALAPRALNSAFCSVCRGDRKSIREDVTDKLSCFLSIEEYYPNRFAELCGAQDYRPREKKVE